MSDLPLLSIERNPDRQPTTVTISGELDLSTSPLLHATFADGVERSSTAILDCGGLTFVDSSGLSAILTETKAMREAGGHLLLAEVTPLTGDQVGRARRSLRVRRRAGGCHDADVRHRCAVIVTTARSRRGRQALRHRSVAHRVERPTNVPHRRSRR